MDGHGNLGSTLGNMDGVEQLILVEAREVEFVGRQRQAAAGLEPYPAELGPGLPPGPSRLGV